MFVIMPTNQTCCDLHPCNLVFAWSSCLARIVSGAAPAMAGAAAGYSRCETEENGTLLQSFAFQVAPLMHRISSVFCTAQQLMSCLPSHSLTLRLPDLSPKKLKPLSPKGPKPSPLSQVMDQMTLCTSNSGPDFS